MKKLAPDYEITGPVNGPFGVRIGYREGGWFRIKQTWVRPAFVKQFDTLEEARKWCVEHCRRYMGDSEVRETISPSATIL